jgi:transposase
MPSFLAGHVSAFGFFGGVPRVLLYDNLKSAVLERKGDAIRFHPTLLELSAHYRYEPRPVAVARGNEKGRVERAIQYIRTSFFPARNYDGLADLNRQALEVVPNDGGGAALAREREAAGARRFRAGAAEPAGVTRAQLPL